MKHFNIQKSEKIFGISLIAIVLITTSVTLLLVYWQPPAVGQSVIPEAYNGTAGIATANVTIITPSQLAYGPIFYLGCAGNQTVLILPGAHPANTSDVYPSSFAMQEAQHIGVYCDNSGNLINATNGAKIPFPSP